ncbi:hypothetical protein [Frisingicoccus sp.]|uniref:hypothetical protein n=1 Tax=Frisingicoccus sp. TaxID=1918627 RepID=UPI002A7ECDB3|nr:hypothetical protein [Frisingicoccus sp.]MCI7129909.1 hypothetical protein [Lachnospiraceae bacterium]MDD7178307.1 hypothetical protein [bacterium]MDY4922665.1 hypothetical protein [Frisingicoccus sp.]MDY5516932.1 hypothetical protein [Lachnospiraceae bacterium]
MLFEKNINGESVWFDEDNAQELEYDSMAYERYDSVLESDDGKYILARERDTGKWTHDIWI